MRSYSCATRGRVDFKIGALPAGKTLPWLAGYGCQQAGPLPELQKTVCHHVAAGSSENTVDAAGKRHADAGGPQRPPDRGGMEKLLEALSFGVKPQDLGICRSLEKRDHADSNSGYLTRRRRASSTGGYYVSHPEGDYSRRRFLGAGLLAGSRLKTKQGLKNAQTRRLEGLKLGGDVELRLVLVPPMRCWS